MDIFEFATRNKIRFPVKGSIPVEQVWDLEDAEIDLLDAQLQERAEKRQKRSLFSTQTKTDKTLDVMIAILSHIASVRLTERANAENAKLVADERKRLLGIKARQKEKEEENLSPDEIDKRLAALS